MTKAWMAQNMRLSRVGNGVGANCRRVKFALQKKKYPDNDSSNRTLSTTRRVLAGFHPVEGTTVRVLRMHERDSDTYLTLYACPICIYGLLRDLF
jgi:hypothetical protein